MLPARVLRLLDALLTTLAVLLAVQSVMMPTSRVVMVASVATCVVMVASWMLWRTRGRRWPLVLLSISPMVNVMLSGGGGASTVAVLLGLAALTYAYGVRTGTLMVAAFTVVDTLEVSIRYGTRALLEALVNVVGTFLVLMMGVVVGLVLRELSAERRHNAELVDQVRNAAVIEQELMLADERARSARELHDGLGHQLTLVVLSLGYAERMRDTAPDKAFAEVHQAHETATGALGYLRRWVRALNPPREVEVTGTAAFEAIASSFRGTGLDITVTHTGEERELGRAVSLFALRMVQEGLTNVVRHSAASAVHLHLDWEPDALTLSLRDNGGAPDGLREGFGLRSLAERANGLGGSFIVRPDADGVELVGRVPLAASGHSAGAAPKRIG